MATEDVDLPGPEDSPACFCPLEGTLATLSAKYAMQVVCAVGAFGEARFSDLEAAIPDASTSTLSARLDDLEDAGLVTREQYDEIPPRVEYALTDDGRALCERLVPLLEWAAERDR
jgi:DNA-binding HxlR family transcriptional regulator